MPFGFMSLYKIRVIGFAELNVRNCASNSSCNEKAALNSNFVSTRVIGYAKLKVRGKTSTRIIVEANPKLLLLITNY